MNAGSALSIFVILGTFGGPVAGCAGTAQSEAAPASAEQPPASGSAAALEPGASAAASASESGSEKPAGPTGEGAAEAPTEGDPDKRTMDVIAAVVRSHRKEARECYEKALKQVPGLKGDLVIHFILKPSGKVKLADLNRERSTITEPSVVSCVVDVISAIEFPKSSRGMETTVNYPFNFNP